MSELQNCYAQFKLLNVRVYENDWDYSSSIEMDVVDGMVRIVEADHKTRKPETLWRDITDISLTRMMQIMGAASTDEICFNTRNYFERHGIDDFLNLLQGAGIEYKYREYTTSFPRKDDVLNEESPKN